MLGQPAQGEVLIYDHALNKDERAAVENYLKAKWFKPEDADWPVPVWFSDPDD